MIKREQQQEDWQQIMQVTGDPRTGATNSVQQKEGNRIIDINEPNAMTSEIQQVTEKRFGLAKSASVNSLSLRNSVGFCASTTFSADLLKGKVAIPGDIDKATTSLIKEMQSLGIKLSPLQSQTKITPDIYRFYWGWVNECTSSALSKIHFGHWNAIRQSPELTKLAWSHLNLIARMDIPQQQWGNGLQVLLEKIPGVALVDKLRAILLMEGNFNFFNK